MHTLKNTKYTLLLMLLMMIFLIFPMLNFSSGNEYVYHILQTVLFLAALRILVVQRTLRRVGVATAALCLSVLWLGVLRVEFQTPLYFCLSHAAASLFLAITVLGILRAVYQKREVTADSVCGAFCGYFLTGIIMGHIYCIVELNAPGSFSVPDAMRFRLSNPAEHHYLLTYFSLITLTTTGFGDITPASDTARSLAAVEAVIGQFYVAVLIAELMGKKFNPPRHESDLK